MNCTNCGAPMELFPHRRYYFCRHCGAFHFLDAPEIEGLEVLVREADARACPNCGDGMSRSLLDRVHDVEHCQRCRGVLMARRTFAEVVSRRRAWASGPAMPPQPLDRRELDRHITCPSCRGRMEVHPYYGPGNVVMDSCGNCDIVWLDFGELRQIVDAPGRDRASRAGPGPSSDDRVYKGPPGRRPRDAPPDPSTDLIGWLKAILS